MSALDVEIGERVHQALWRQRVQQAELAEALGLDQAAVSRRLRGRTAWRVSDLLTAARVLGIPVEQLLPSDPATAAKTEGGAVTRCIPPLPRRLRSVPALEVAQTRRHAFSSAQILRNIPCPA